jgi:murein DD-endopeptidase
MPQRNPPLSIPELFGLRPYDRMLAQARLALFGDADAPRVRWGLSSLRQYRPGLAIGLYLGRPHRPRTAVITNLFNHRQPPPKEGWAVTVTDVADFRGGNLTYDSHNGTDFSVPPGSTVVAPAPGVVSRVSSEFHRGGLKVFIDHGEGLMTSCNHLGRVLVEVGRTVRRGEPIGVSGYSGIDAVAGFPFTPPHIHFNVFLDGAHVDPFARPGEVSLWRTAMPTPHTGPDAPESPAAETTFDETLMASVAAEIRRPELLAELSAAANIRERATTLYYFMSVYPWLFSSRRSFSVAPHARRPRLDLPLSAEEYDGAVLWDEPVKTA